MFLSGRFLYPIHIKSITLDSTGSVTAKNSTIHDVIPNSLCCFRLQQLGLSMSCAVRRNAVWIRIRRNAVQIHSENTGHLHLSGWISGCDALRKAAICSVRKQQDAQTAHGTSGARTSWLVVYEALWPFSVSIRQTAQHRLILGDFWWLLADASR